VKSLASVFLAILVLAGCTEESGRPGDGQGPLSAMVGKGGFTAAAPRDASRWTETFGAFLLCSTEPDREIHIKDVRFDVSPEPLAIDTWFREIPAAAQRNGGNASAWAPMVSDRGTPPFDGRYRGDFVKSLDVPITQTCSQSRPDSALIELLTTMTVDERGALIRRTFVDYQVDDEEFTLTIHWQNGMCGAAVDNRGC